MHNMMQEHFVEIGRSLDDDSDLDEHLDRLPEVQQHEIVKLLVLQSEWIVEAVSFEAIFSP